MPDAIAAMRDDTAEIYPPGAPMTYWRLTAERNALRLRLRHLDDIRAGCSTCEHWHPARKHCDHFDDTPPDGFEKEVGRCEFWVFDGCPF
jgi:hypothetical protein